MVTGRFTETPGETPCPACSGRTTSPIGEWCPSCGRCRALVPDLTLPPPPPGRGVLGEAGWFGLGLASLACWIGGCFFARSLWEVFALLSTPALARALRSAAIKQREDPGAA